MTILRTDKAIIKGNLKTVETVLGQGNRQDISYVVNGKKVAYNAFWSTKPTFVN